MSQIAAFYAKKFYKILKIEDLCRKFVDYGLKVRPSACRVACQMDRPQGCNVWNTSAESQINTLFVTKSSKNRDSVMFWNSLWPTWLHSLLFEVNVVIRQQMKANRQIMISRTPFVLERCARVKHLLCSCSSVYLRYFEEKLC